MPVSIRKVDGYRVSTPGGVKAKHTSLARARSQARLLNAVEHGFNPTGKKRRTTISEAYSKSKSSRRRKR